MKKSDKIKKVMHEFKENELKSSSGKTVTNPKQAIAIALSESRKMKNGGDVGIDLFEDYENIPAKVQTILDKYEDAFVDGDYKELEKAHKALNKIGYTFEYYLDGQAYDLRRIGTKGKSEMNEFRKGGSLDNENSDMVLNNNKQISHHTKELANAVNKNKNIPAWVVAKVNRSATDISDATHYLEGAKYKKGGKLGFCYSIGGL